VLAASQGSSPSLNIDYDCFYAESLFNGFGGDGGPHAKRTGSGARTPVGIVYGRSGGLGSVAAPDLRCCSQLSVLRRRARTRNSFITGRARAVAAAEAVKSLPWRRDVRRTGAHPR